MSTSTDASTTTGTPRCGCCGQPRSALAELGVTPGVFICRRCGLWAARRARGRTVDLLAATDPIDRHALHAEMNRACATFLQMTQAASPADLRRASAGTRWSNRQLLFHLVLGYLVVLRLLPLVQLFGRLPEGASRRFAAVLDAGTRPFHVVNYLGSCAGAAVLTPAQMAALLGRTVALLHRRLDAAPEADLRRRMHFPVRWDPFFTDVMTLADVFHFGTQHFDFHLAQLTLGSGPASA